MKIILIILHQLDDNQQQYIGYIHQAQYQLSFIDKKQQQPQEHNNDDHDEIRFILRNNSTNNR